MKGVVACVLSHCNRIQPNEINSAQTRVLTVRCLKKCSLCWRLLDEGLKTAPSFAWLCESECACEIRLVSHTGLQSDSIPDCSGRGTQQSAAACAEHKYSLSKSIWWCRIRNEVKNHFSHPIPASCACFWTSHLFYFSLPFLWTSAESVWSASMHTAQSFLSYLLSHVTDSYSCKCFSRPSLQLCVSTPTRPTGLTPATSFQSGQKKTCWPFGEATVWQRKIRWTCFKLLIVTG